MDTQTNKGEKTKFSLGTYIKETRQELKKVTWPTKKELLKNTGVVLTVVITSTLLDWVIDTLLSGILGLILK